MSKIGRFIIKHFKDKEIEMFTNNESETINYADSNNFSWTIIVGKVVDYDDESGTIILEGPDHKRFYVNEYSVLLFWEPGFDIRNCAKATRNMTNKKIDRDIM